MGGLIYPPQGFASSPPKRLYAPDGSVVWDGTTSPTTLYGAKLQGDGTLITGLNAQQWGGAKNDIVFVSGPASNFSTTSASIVSTGFGTSLAPSTSRILIDGWLNLASSSSGAIGYVYLYRSTVGIPAAGAAPNAGDVQVGPNHYPGTPLTLGGYLDSGLTPGTTYYYYVAIVSTAATNYLISGSYITLQSR